MSRGKPQARSLLNIQHGFTIIALMVALLLLALGTQGVMVSLSDQAEREREAQLKRVNAIYAKAIKDYYEASPGTNKQYPEKLEDLLLDKRFVTTRRHLRQLYENPTKLPPTLAAWKFDRDQSGRITAVLP
jgi:type II secretory pathway pseudopilin PulG